MNNEDEEWKIEDRSGKYGQIESTTYEDILGKNWTGFIENYYFI